MKGADSLMTETQITGGTQKTSDNETSSPRKKRNGTTVNSRNMMADKNGAAASAKGASASKIRAKHVVASKDSHIPSKGNQSSASTTGQPKSAGRTGTGRDRIRATKNSVIPQKRTSLTADAPIKKTHSDSPLSSMQRTRTVSPLARQRQSVGSGSKQDRRQSLHPEVTPTSTSMPPPPPPAAKRASAPPPPIPPRSIVPPRQVAAATQARPPRNTAAYGMTLPPSGVVTSTVGSAGIRSSAAPNCRTTLTGYIAPSGGSGLYNFDPIPFTRTNAPPVDNVPARSDTVHGAFGTSNALGISSPYITSAVSTDAGYLYPSTPSPALPENSHWEYLSNDIEDTDIEALIIGQSLFSRVRELTTNLFGSRPGEHVGNTTLIKRFLTDKRIRIAAGIAAGVLIITTTMALASSEDATEPDENNATLTIKNGDEETQTFSANIEAPPKAAFENTKKPAEENTTGTENEANAVAETPPPAVNETGAVAAADFEEERHVGKGKRRHSRRRSSRSHRHHSSRTHVSSQTRSASVGGGDANTAAKPLFGGDEPAHIPVTLSRSAIQQGMNRVANRVKKCGKKETRPVVMSVTIGKNGNVKNVVATGSFAGTDIGSCVARIVRNATFPKAQRDMTVKYPFHL